MLNPEQTLYWVVPPQDEEPADPNRLPYYAFRPRRKDNGKLSVYDAAKITPRECLELYNAQSDAPQSTRVARITAADLQQFGLQAEPDPEPHPAHLLIDFNSLSRSRANRIASELTERAEQAGVLIP